MGKGFFMRITLLTVIAAVGLSGGSAVAATMPPAEVATVIVHGFSADGVAHAGVVGEDSAYIYATKLVSATGLPSGLADPLAPNQVTATTYYGNQYPSYYTPQDVADVNAVTATFGGGVPRYAAIVAKYARHVMERSGASQVSLVGVSFGGLITRYIIEKDLENLASTGKIARWIGVEGVIAGNYAATNGGPLAEVFFSQQYGGIPIDLDHMKYTWVNANIHTPYYSSEAPWLADFPVHFWIAGDDNLFGKFVTQMSGKANDGVVLQEDAVLRHLPAELLHEGMLPTASVLHANHDTLKDAPGLYAGLAAQLFSRHRVTVRLRHVEVLREFDGGPRGKGEYVFGAQVFSPQAEAAGVTTPIQDLRAEDNSLPFIELSPAAPQAVNFTWFDDMVLPGETTLRLKTNVEEIDGDLIYQINEQAGEVRQALTNAELEISATHNGEYPIETADWRGIVEVKVKYYTGFGGVVTAAQDWALYE